VPVAASHIAGNLEGSVEYSSASLRVGYLFPGAVCRATTDTGTGTDTPYSYLSAFTGSRRAAKYAGMRAAMEQIRKPLTQITKTSRGTISAGISENW